MAKKRASSNGESISAYFRKVFDENPKLLKTRSNQELYDRWLQDHPGETKVPEKVRQNLSNVKSVLRKKSRKRGRRKTATEAADTAVFATAPAVRKLSKGLDLLEEQIDDCLSMAKQLDREGLANVISMLRRARNEVVWKMGETAER